MTEPSVDLSQLSLDRSSQKSTGNGRPRKWLSRYVLPALILLIFVAILLVAAGKSLFPAKSVTVVPVLSQRGQVQRAGTPLFKAAGWVEPRPTAIRVAALTAGVVEDVLVVEGDRVEKDQPIARLISIDAELEVEQSRASLALRQGELERAQAEEEAARTRFNEPVHLRAALAEANSQLAKARTEYHRLPYQIKAAEARLVFARQNADGKRAAREAVAGRVLQEAESEQATAEAAVEGLRTSKGDLQLEITALEEKVAALTAGLELLIEEKRQLKEATAKVVAATARIKQAEVALRQAELNLNRCVIKAPLTGRVLRLIAAPGSRVTGMADSGSHSSSTIVEMYEPDRLQVRADVRLEDVPRVLPGAPVRIETASSNKPLKGRVLQPTSTANIQKNTLEVKVELLEQSPTVSPEMLVTATFLAPETEGTSTAEPEELILIPTEVIQTSGDGSVVWTISAEQTAQRQRISTGGRTSVGLVEVTAGLDVTDKVIYPVPADLEEGDKVTVTGEDQSLGRQGLPAVPDGSLQSNEDE